MSLLLAGGCTPADTLNLLARPGTWELTASIPYASGDRRSLDVYRPVNAKDAPVVVFFYGGNWQNGSKEIYRFLAATLANHGYVAIVPDYRVYPEVKFPDFLADGAQAVRWAKRNAAGFGGDPDKLFIMGHSAGAHIAAMLTLDPQWLAAVGLNAKRDVAGLIGLAGPYDFLPLRDPTLKVIFGPGDLAHTQPITFVDGVEPPALLATGAGDTTVSPGNTTRLSARLRQNGGTVTEIVYPRIGHVPIIGAFSPVLRFLAPVVRDVDGFIARTLAQRSAHGAALPRAAAQP